MHLIVKLYDIVGQSIKDILWSLATFTCIIGIKMILSFFILFLGKKGDHLRQVKEETHTNISVSK